VPALILQPLVENTVRHGLSGRARGGVLRVRAREVDGARVLAHEPSANPASGAGAATQAVPAACRVLPSPGSGS
jgi:LytS/YehU family sensor histidine kinase